MHLGIPFAVFAARVYVVFLSAFLLRRDFKEFWSTKGLSWIYTYVVLLSIVAKTFVEIFMIVAADPNVSAKLKLGLRFILVPLFWEFVRAIERHYARLNPSPGPCLQLPYFVSFTLQQAFFSRYIMFLISAGGAVKNMANVQAVLSLHELMINVVQKDRDIYLVKLFLGKQSADAMLISRKQHDIVALNSIVSSFAEICAVIIDFAIFVRLQNGERWKREHRGFASVRIASGQLDCDRSCSFIFHHVRATAIPRNTPW